MESADVLVFDSTEEVSIKMSVELLAKVELIKDDSGYTVARTHVNEPAHSSHNTKNSTVASLSILITCIIHYLIMIPYQYT